MSRPFAISFAVTLDLALNATAAALGPQHVPHLDPPIAQFGALVACGIVVHQIGTHLRDFWRWLPRRRIAASVRRWRRRG